MRKINQIEFVQTQFEDRKVYDLYAVCMDGTLWHKRNSSDSTLEHGWEFVPGPPEGDPEQKLLTLAEQVRELNKHTGTFLSDKLKEGES